MGDRKREGQAQDQEPGEGGGHSDSLGSSVAFPRDEEGTEAGSGGVGKSNGKGGVTSIALWAWSWFSGD